MRENESGDLRYATLSVAITNGFSVYRSFHLDSNQNLSHYKSVRYFSSRCTGKSSEDGFRR